jgi:phosphoribosylanthranilate isomerase
VAAAAGIVSALPPFVVPVAVLVNQPLAAILDTMPQFGGVSTIQWHGDDPPLFPRSAYRFVPAFSIGAASDLANMKRYLEKCRAGDSLPAAVLLDGHRAGLHGGTGQPAPWELLAGFDPGVPIILAGGLTPDNVAEAIRIVRPYAVDVASGVESSPGRKDADKMRRFIDNARSAAAGIVSHG